MGVHIWHEIKKFFVGAHIERIFQAQPGPEISVHDAAQTAATFLGKVIDAINGPIYAVLKVILSDNAQASIEAIKAELIIIQADLLQVTLIPDIATKLQDYRFAEDDNRNILYHKIVTSAALIFSDGKLSLNDAESVIELVSEFKQL